MDGRIDLQHFLFTLAAKVVPGIAIMVLAYRQSPWFIRWRTHCVVPVRLARSAAIFVTQSEFYNRDCVHPLALPASSARLVVHLLRVVGASLHLPCRVPVPVLGCQMRLPAVSVLTRLHLLCFSLS